MEELRTLKKLVADWPKSETDNITHSKMKNVGLKWCVSQQEDDIQNFPPKLNSKWDVWHQCHSSTWLELLLSPLGSVLSFCQRVDQPNLSLGQRTVTHCQLHIAAKTVLYASISFASAAPAPLASFFFLFLFSPPSILLTTCPASAEMEC